MKHFMIIASLSNRATGELWELLDVLVISVVIFWEICPKPITKFGITVIREIIPHVAVYVP